MDEEKFIIYIDKKGEDLYERQRPIRMITQ